MSAQQPKIVYGLFCEFIRMEMSGQTTAIGIWGETCRVGASAPVVLPALAFHAYICNLGRVAYNAKIKVAFPGKAAPVEMTAPVSSEQIQDSQNLNVNMSPVHITEAGDVVATIELDTTPPIRREFRLHIEFQPGATLMPAQTPILMKATKS
jgi:hypothetical protein